MTDLSNQNHQIVVQNEFKICTPILSFFYLSDFFTPKKLNFLENLCFLLSLSSQFYFCLCLSFGSGFTLENTDPVYIQSIAQQVSLAHQYNIEVGG